MTRTPITTPEILLLQNLCNAFGPMGCEDAAAQIIRDDLNKNCLFDRVETDLNGNVLAWICADITKAEHTNKADLLVCAHMDEVGFMITNIDDSGYIRFGTVGSIDSRVLCGRRVILGNELSESYVTGIICSKPVHLMSESDRANPTPIDKMYIDIGAKDKKEAEELLQIGDFGTFAANFSAVTIDDGFKAPYGRIVSKAIDDRIGCAVMLCALRRLKAEGKRPTKDLCFAFTVGEEGGIKGAAMASYKTRPEYAVILESTTAADIADVEETRRVVTLGEGGALSLADNGTLYDIDYVTSIMKLAENKGINCQYKRYVSGGNDSSAVQKAAGGVKVAALSCPTRYLHTATTVADAADYTAMIDLLYAIITD